jgi:hypothetical protein
MTTNITRRGILKALGIGSLALAAEPILEPARKLWFVGSNAPVGSRIERLDAATARAWSLKLNISEEDLEDSRFDELIRAAREMKKTMYAQLERDMARELRSQHLYGQAAGGGKIGYCDDLGVAGPGAWLIESTETMHNGNVRLLVRQQAEGTLEISTLNDLVMPKS